MWSQPTQHEAKATIILAHPMGKAAKAEFLKTDYAYFLLKNGYNVVIFDFNGFGESSMGSFYYHHDLIIVRDKAVQLFPGKPLALHGISFGANWGTVALQREDNTISVAILESGATNLPEFWIHYPMAHRILRWLYRIRPSYEQYANFEQAISQTKNCKKLLFIYADPDDYTPVSMGVRLKKSSNVDADLELFEGASHAMAVRADKERYFTLTLQFLNEAFEPEPLEKELVPV